MKQKRCRIEDNLFQITWMVQRGGVRQDALNWYCDNLGVDRVVDPETQVVASFYQAPGYKNGVLWFSDKCGAGAITHETIHASLHTMENHFIKISSETEELLAYYADFLAREIVRKLW